MANRHWVGGTATWDGTAGSKWAATSGGAGGQSVPTSSDDVFFDSASGSVTVSTSGTLTMRDLTLTGFTGTFGTGTTVQISGSLTCGSSAGAKPPGGASLQFLGTSTHTITSSGKTLANSVTFDGVGGSWTLQDDFNTGTTAVTLTNGTFDANGFNVSCNSFSSSNSNTRTISMGSGTWTVGGSGTVWTTATSTNLTLNPGTSTLVLSSSTSLSRTVTCNSVPIGSVNVTAGTGTVTLTNLVCNDLNFTGFSGTLGNSVIMPAGSVTFATGMTVGDGGSAITMTATSGTKTFTSAGVQIQRPLTFNGVGGTWVLQDDLDMGATRILTLTNGTLDFNEKNVSCGSISTNNSNTRALDISNSTVTLQAVNNAWLMSTSTGMTLTSTGSTIKITDASATNKTFAGGGLSYGRLWLTGGGTGTFTITGSNTFTILKMDTPPHTLIVTAGTTQTIAPNGWEITGTAGNLMTLQSSTATNFNVSMSTGTVVTDYLSLTDSNAIGGATWYAGANSTDGGDNSGWIFSGGPSRSLTGFSSITGIQTITF